MMTSVGLIGVKYMIIALRLKEMKGMRYSMEPGLVSGAFLYLILVGQTVGHIGVFPDSSFYEMMSIFVYLAGGIYTFSMLRFIHVVKSFLKSKKEAEEKLTQLSADDAMKINEIVQEKFHNQISQ